jgi:DNA ligase-1
MVYNVLIITTVHLLKDHSSPHIQIAPMEVCKNAQHMESFLQDIIDGGGEGIILRDPSDSLQSGRSAGYLKHKV